MADPQGQPQAPSTTEPGSQTASPQQGGQPTGLSADSVQQFVVDPSNAQQGGQQPDTVRDLQSSRDKERAARLKAEYELMQLRQQSQPQQAPQNGNPYNPETQSTEYWRHEMQNAARQAALEVAKIQQDQFQGILQSAYESKWQTEHPDVDIGTLKMFQQTHGIRDIDDAYKVWKYDSDVQNATLRGQQQGISQFRQPNLPQASPIRGTTGGGAEVIGVKFQDMLQAYTQNPAIADTWPQELQKMFFAELSAAHKALGR